MPQIKQLGRVMIPVADQDTAIAFYSEKLGFSLTADVPFGDGDRWVEVSPPRGGATVSAASLLTRLETGFVTTTL